MDSLGKSTDTVEVGVENPDKMPTSFMDGPIVQEAQTQQLI